MDWIGRVQTRRVLRPGEVEEEAGCCAKPSEQSSEDDLDLLLCVCPTPAFSRRLLPRNWDGR